MRKQMWKIEIKSESGIMENKVLTVAKPQSWGFHREELDAYPFWQPMALALQTSCYSWIQCVHMWWL